MPPAYGKTNLNQEQHCVRSVSLLQPQTTYRGSSPLASDHFQQSYNTTTPAQLRTMEERSTNPSPC
ncbi:hypothetical protein M378DRAFT_168716, partial [Amanita muscaria Koide BX008]